MSESTVTSNREAAQLAAQTERSRVLSILELADPPVSAKVLRTIANGVPFAQAKRSIAAQDAEPNKTGGPSAPGSAKPAGSKWGEVVRRTNERQQSKRSDAPAKSGKT